MTFRIIYTVSLALFVCSAPLALTQSPGVDPYAHFIGDWQGTDHFDKKGTYVTEPIAIHITELKGRKGMRLEFSMGDGQTYPVESWRKESSLDSPREEMHVRFGFLKTNDYLTAGLKAFAATGLGTFLVRSVALEQGLPVEYSGEYRLSEQELSWTWQRAEQGQPPKLYGDYKLHRAVKPQP